MATKRDILDALARGEGPLAQAHDDEPLFILRAADAIAPTVVGIWDDIARLVHVDDEKRIGARTCAGAMMLWQARHPDLVKVPD